MILLRMIPVNPVERTLKGEVEADSTLSVNRDGAGDFGRALTWIGAPCAEMAVSGPLM